MSLALVTSAFGKYIKFYVCPKKAKSSAPAPVSRNAFEVMMTAACAQSSRVLPPKIGMCRTKKDELFNSIVEWLEKDNLTWKSSEVDSGTATNTVSTLQCALWYIDGHQKTLADRSCSVPKVCWI